MPVKNIPDKASPDPDSPLTKYHVTHLEGNRTRRWPCVHFITFGRDYGPVTIRFPTILRLDLSSYETPPQSLCSTFTGMHYKIRNSFFSFQANEAAFHRALKELRGTVKNAPRGECVAYVINCTAGRHRSVAMAERLSRTVDEVDGFRAECLHLDLDKGADLRDVRLARVNTEEMSEDLPKRGRARSRDEARTSSDTRGEENGLRVAADAGPSRRGASLHRKTVSWGTPVPVRDPRPQQRETFGRSAGPSRKGETRRSRLPP